MASDETSLQPGLVHAYGIVDPETPVPLPPSGIAGQTVFLVRVEGVAAVVSNLPAEEYGIDAWRTHAEDPEWLASVAAEHNAVLQELAVGTDVLPLRLPALYRDIADVERVLHEERAEFRAALEQVRGHLEWGAKIFLVGDPSASEPEDRPTSGRDYLMRKAAAGRRKEDAAQLRRTMILDVHEELAMASTHAVVNATQDRALTGRQEPMVFNAAYLVSRGGQDHFLSLAQEKVALLQSEGMALEVSGPWAAYNFAGRSEAPTRGAAP